MTLIAPMSPFLRCEITKVAKNQDGTFQVHFTGGEEENITRHTLDMLRRNQLLSESNRNKLFAALTA